MIILGLGLIILTTSVLIASYARHSSEKPGVTSPPCCKVKIPDCASDGTKSRMGEDMILETFSRQFLFITPF